MTKFHAKADSTVNRTANLPLDLSNADSVKAHFEGDGIQTITASISDQSSGKITLPMQNLTLETGMVYKVEYEISFSDGTVDTLPRQSYDLLEVKDDLA